MNTPFKFNLQLASEPIRWPLITRDGRNATYVCEHSLNGWFQYRIKGESHNRAATHAVFLNGTNEHPFDPLLSSNLTDQAVRDAVKRCHEAKMKIAFKGTVNPDSRWYILDDNEEPIWAWGVLEYLPAVLVPEVQPEKPQPQIAPGHNPDKLSEDTLQKNRETLTKPDFVKCSDAEWNTRPARLLAEDEIKNRSAKTHKIEEWLTNGKKWGEKPVFGCLTVVTMRSTLTRCGWIGCRSLTLGPPTTTASFTLPREHSAACAKPSTPR